MTLKHPASMLALTSLAALLLAPRHFAAQAPAPRIDIVAMRFEYAPARIDLKLGVPVVLALTSKDVDHGLKFKDLDLALKARKGETTEVKFTPTQAGTFTGQCSVFCGSGHGSMKMTLHVTE